MLVLSMWYFTLMNDEKVFFYVTASYLVFILYYLYWGVLLMCAANLRLTLLGIHFSLVL